jgi:O-antigen ligase
MTKLPAVELPKDVREIGPPRAARSMSVPRVHDWRQRLTLAGAMLVLSVAALAGGGRGGLGDVAAQLSSLPLFAWLAWCGLNGKLEWRAPMWVRCLPVLVLALPLLQLLPVPEAIWRMGAARAELAAQLRSVGVEPVQLLSLDPTATEAMLLGLLPPIALYLAVLTLGRRAVAWLLVLVGLVALLNVCLGMAQLGQGHGSPLRLYYPTNADQAVGLFANRNHLACLLAMCLPPALCGTAWALVERMSGRNISPFLVVAGGVFVVLLIIGITMTGSRGGLLLGMLAVLASWPVAMSLRRQKGASRLLAVTVVLALVLAVQFSMVGVLKRLEGDAQEDGRWQYAQVTLQAAKNYLPWGSGLGTFRQAYQPFEAKAGPTSVIINHAHNDYLELWLEGGVPFLLLLGLGAAAWGSRGWALARGKEEEGSSELLVARAFWLAASVGLAHSALDYPLRTTANICVFALFAAVAWRGLRRNAASGHSLQEIAR